MATPDVVAADEPPGGVEPACSSDGVEAIGPTDGVEPD